MPITATPVLTPGKLFYSVVFGHGVFVALAYDMDSGADVILSSVDGETWVLRHTFQHPQPDHNGAWGVAHFTGTQFVVAVSSALPNDPWYEDDPALYAVSADGLLWTQRTFPDRVSFFGPDGAATRGGVTALLVQAVNGDWTTQAYITSDFVSWTASGEIAPFHVGPLTASADTFFLGSWEWNPQICRASIDGVVWTERGAFPAAAGTTRNFWSSLIHVGNVLLAVKARQSSSPHGGTTVSTVPATERVARSTDGGHTWVATEFPFSADWWMHMTRDGSTVYGTDNNGVYRSFDAGLTWEHYAALTATLFVESAAVGNGRVIVVGYGEAIDVIATYDAPSAPGAFWTGFTNCKEVE
jgi:hypothetical protein